MAFTFSPQHTSRSIGKTTRNPQHSGTYDDWYLQLNSSFNRHYYTFRSHACVYDKANERFFLFCLSTAHSRDVVIFALIIVDRHTYESTQEYRYTITESRNDYTIGDIRLSVHLVYC